MPLGALLLAQRPIPSWRHDALQPATEDSYFASYVWVDVIGRICLAGSQKVSQTGGVVESAVLTHNRSVFSVTRVK